MDKKQKRKEKMHSARDYQIPCSCSFAYLCLNYAKVSQTMPREVQSAVRTRKFSELRVPSFHIAMLYFEQLKNVFRRTFFLNPFPMDFFWLTGSIPEKIERRRRPREAYTAEATKKWPCAISQVNQSCQNQAKPGHQAFIWAEGVLQEKLCPE